MNGADWQPNVEGVWFDLPASAYRDAPGVSNSMLKELARSPAHLQASLAQPDEPTPSMILGSIVHQMVLEPDKAPWWVVMPEGMKLSTKEGKAWKELQGPARIIDHETWVNIQGAVEAIRTHPLASAAFGHGRAEVSVFQRFCYGGSVLRKGRLDFVSEGQAVVDLKTTEDARPESFAREVWLRKYHVQGAYYLDLWNSARPEERKPDFAIVAVEKSPPFALSVYRLDETAIARGRREYIDLLARYMDCQEANQWPAYSQDLQVLSLPPWALKQDTNSFAA